MPLLEMNASDQRRARVCDPATAKRYRLDYTAHDGTPQALRHVLPSDIERAKEALGGRWSPEGWSR